MKRRLYGQHNDTHRGTWTCCVMRAKAKEGGRIIEGKYGRRHGPSAHPASDTWAKERFLREASEEPGLNPHNAKAWHCLGESWHTCRCVSTSLDPRSSRGGRAWVSGIWNTCVGPPPQQMTNEVLFDPSPRPPREFAKTFR